SSFNAPSSMRVRGWYLPARILPTGNVDGGPSGASATAAGLPMVSIAGPSAPSRASSPRPRPLGFLVAMWQILFTTCYACCGYLVSGIDGGNPRNTLGAQMGTIRPIIYVVNVWITP